MDFLIGHESESPVPQHGANHLIARMYQVGGTGTWQLERKGGGAVPYMNQAGTTSGQRGEWGGFSNDSLTNIVVTSGCLPLTTKSWVSS